MNILGEMLYFNSFFIVIVLCKYSQMRKITVTDFLLILLCY
uniref:Uncharacterized protein n=1 Tax=Anguilla anguilla TaxID=7936 RepID=A0A0E9R251_ANGAN